MSTISTLSSSPPSYQSQNSMQPNFRALTQAIQSGNLSAAQQAYATITQNVPGNGSSGASPSASSNPMQQAMSAIGSALQSGDVAGAQSAMQAMQQGMKAHHGHHRHGGSTPDASQAQQNPGPAPDAGGVAPAPASSPGGSEVDVSA